MRVVFMGTPPAAVPSLRALVDAFDVVAVYTRRDRPRGRGLKVEASAVKNAAVELGLLVVQPRTLRTEAPGVKGFEPDVIAVVAYGMLLPADVLAVPRHGCVNVHFSLLPRWRGAAPVEHAVLAGDERTGVTTMLMDVGMDTGPILYQEPIDIGPDDTTGTVTERLAEVGAHLLVRTVLDLEAGKVQPQPQPASGVTLAPKAEASDAELDPGRPAVELERRVRASNPSPGAFCWLDGRRLKVWRASVVPGDGAAGTIAAIEPDGIDVQTGDARLRLIEVQPEGKRPMPADAFARGHRLAVGQTIGPAAGPEERDPPR
jgi:methionyl-tRNA formyltransferase